ncbi:MAG TPA: DoxX family protein [Cyclobacteriaceae bacterium]|nr:DoxX family protein [Cyclobacteriaceae bacterium]
MKRILFGDSSYREQALAIFRIITGLLLVYHGKEVFDGALMAEYQKWTQFSSSTWLPYLGKGAEFVAGLLLVAGFLTRLAALITIGTFAYITFFIGGGKFWYEDQHPFMFLMVGILFLVAGGGIWSLDRKLN